MSIIDQKTEDDWLGLCRNTSKNSDSDNIEHIQNGMIIG